MLDSGDASAFLSTLPGRRSKEITIVALANLAKFQGRYEQFQELKKRYALKWNQGDPMKNFESFLLNPDINLDTMLQRIREMISVLPTSMSKIVKFGVLVGLRSSELIECVRYINDKEVFPKYYDSAAMTLNHWKMPGMLRTTKKAFLSFVSPDMLSIVQNLVKEEVPSLNAITLACRRRHVPCDTRYCRKVHATWLREHNIPVEIIDALQGRTPASIFARHYYRPSLDYRVKVIDALEQLQKRLEN